MNSSFPRIASYLQQLVTQDSETQREAINSFTCVSVSAHSPYELSPEPFNFGNEQRSSATYTLRDYIKDLMNTYKKSHLPQAGGQVSYRVVDIVKYDSVYTKSTLQNLPVKMNDQNSYSDYQSTGSDPPGHSQAQCEAIRTAGRRLVDKLFRINQTSADGCIPTQLTDVTWFRETLRHYNLTKFCEQGQHTSNTSADRINLILRIHQSIPDYCPQDTNRIVFNFRTAPVSSQTAGDEIRLNGDDGLILLPYYRFSWNLDQIPEMSILFTYKMSPIEFCANLAGLCGIWCGFSMLTFCDQLLCGLKLLARSCQNLQNSKKTKVGIINQQRNRVVIKLTPHYNDETRISSRPVNSFAARVK